MKRVMFGVVLFYVHFLNASEVPPQYSDDNPLNPLSQVMPGGSLEDKFEVKINRRIGRFAKQKACGTVGQFRELVESRERAVKARKEADLLPTMISREEHDRIVAEALKALPEGAVLRDDLRMLLRLNTAVVCGLTCTFIGGFYLLKMHF